MPLIDLPLNCYATRVGGFRVDSKNVLDGATICKQFDLHFRDEPSYIEAFYELQVFGLYSIASGVRTQCGQDLRRMILTILNGDLPP
jgi:hypothetical protein